MTITAGPITERYEARSTHDAALAASEFHYGPCTRATGARGGVTVSTVRFRRTGRVQLFTKTPGRYAIPTKHGLYGPSHHITETDIASGRFHAAQDCPFAS